MANNVAEVFTFPTDISEFDSDERISFSRLDSKYIAVQDDGTEFEFDQGLKRWIPLADDDVPGVDDQGPDAGDYGRQPLQQGQNPTDARSDQGRKRKPDHAYYNNETQNQNEQEGDKNTKPANNAASSNKRAKGPAAPRQPKQNTAVYVTGLPSDATVDEVAELFSRKCGVIAEEIDSGRPRIKMYADSDGQFKGDALIVFFKPQSVEMAIMLLDDTEFRFEPTPGEQPRRMHVQAADSSYKKTNYAEQAAGGDGQAAGGAPGATSSNAASKPSHGGGKGQDKHKIIKKTQKLDAKLADWSSDEDERFYGVNGGRGGSGRNPKWDKVVVLKHMFTLAELDEDPAALLDIKEDIREECAKLGEVTNVVLFDQEAAGIVSVKFKAAESALACVRMMGGRAFDGRIVEATLATGHEKHQKSKKGDDDDASQDSDDY
ncbi:splicing factor u2af-associated protein 2 [Ophiostoma piceae UAMH 11346]|uniref:Splicing factor u2af-associated protein 2 n=1 Tax=Ophiostoma piceae (strain UAMH 11346) TaxID=1262450 RepID=S3CBT9_OPHP1|nr:splicing factor u2af-associated protein 2 [Ophiostoma piceae UAMH 11346]